MGIVAFLTSTVYHGLTHMMGARWGVTKQSRVTPELSAPNPLAAVLANGTGKWASSTTFQSDLAHC